jgi:hypothetical protein
MQVTSMIVCVAMALLPTTARADEDAELTPHMGWSVGVGPVAELVPSTTAGAFGTAGLQLDIGDRISNVYLGVSGELSYIYGHPDLMGDKFSTDVPSLRARAGLELRYALSSWNAYRTCWGTSPPGTFWVGLRVGPEDVDGTFGEFADISIGGDHWYWRGGVSIDPAGTYGEQILMGRPVAGLPGAVTPFVGAGFRAVFH